MDDRLKKLIQEFSKELISSVSEFQELREAKKALENDPPSKKIWENKEEKRQTVELMKSKGLPVSEKQQQELTQNLKEMREDPIAMRYLKAKNLAGKISGNIGANLNDIIGVDFSPRRGCK